MLRGQLAVRPEIKLRFWYSIAVYKDGWFILLALQCFLLRLCCRIQDCPISSVDYRAHQCSPSKMALFLPKKGELCVPITWCLGVWHDITFWCHWHGVFSNSLKGWRSGEVWHCVLTWLDTYVKSLSSNKPWTSETSLRFSHLSHRLFIVAWVLPYNFLLFSLILVCRCLNRT